MVKRLELIQGADRRAITDRADLEVLVACLNGAARADSADWTKATGGFLVEGDHWLYDGETGRFSRLSMKTSPVYRVDETCRGAFENQFRSLKEVHTTPVVAQAGLPANASAAEIGRIEYAGDAPGALELAEQVVAARPGDVKSRLAGACAAIESNQLGRASALLEPLERTSLVAPRAPVLRHLIARRAAHPTEPLLLALAAAWHEAGHPNLAEDEPDLANPSLTPLPPLSAKGAAERLLFEPPSDKEELSSLAIEASRVAEQLPAAVGLQVLGALASLPCPVDASRRNEAVERARQAAGRALPGNGYVALAGLLARCPRVWTGREVDELALIAGSPTLRYPRERAFDEILSMAQALDPPAARRRAISAWLALDVAAYQLQQLSRESLDDPLLQTLAGRSLETIGRHLADGSAWLEGMVGLALLQRGSRLAGGEDRLEKAGRSLEPTRRAYQSWSTLVRQRGQWPFAAEWQEWTPDEVGRSMAFLEAVEDPSGAVGECLEH